MSVLYDVLKHDPKSANVLS